jgi:Cu+-exporting ATPase
LILIKSGEPVPKDCKILWGEAKVNEAMLTGESIRIYKSQKDLLIGGSTLESGSVKAQVTAVGKDTVLSNILQLVKEAQAEKPPIQQLADRFRAIFVPTVVSLAILTVTGNYLFTSIGFGSSLLRGIAVFVISCPCAMGLATPAAIAVGLGRAARKEILFKNARSLEIFRNIQQVAFDKTGTLTTGHFSITDYVTTIDTVTNVYITKNNELIGSLNVDDTLRPAAIEVIKQLHKNNIQTILLSGNSKIKCERVAAQADIDNVYAEQTPEQKLQTIAQLSAKAPTAMVGDGINDAPALAKATVGISLSDASHIAMQSAQMVLMNHGLTHLPLALGLGKHNYKTIRENLFWAFFYNIIAIPIAAFGYLIPALGALAMGLSDVV